MTTTSPRCTSISIPRNTSRSPNRLWRSSTLTTASPRLQALIRCPRAPREASSSHGERGCIGLRFRPVAVATLVRTYPFEIRRSSRAWKKVKIEVSSQ